MKIVSELESAGYQFTLNGDQIRFNLAPGREVDPEIVKPLLEELRVHKQEVLDYLRQREETPPDDTQPLSIASADPDRVARATALLHSQGHFLMLSRALGERIAIVEHDRFRQDVPQGVPVYTLAEIRLLQQGIEAGIVRTIADLRLLHEAKKRLGGVIVNEP
jgi:hypothetical protein